MIRASQAKNNKNLSRKKNDQTPFAQLRKREKPSSILKMALGFSNFSSSFRIGMQKCKCRNLTSLLSVYNSFLISPDLSLLTQTPLPQR